MYPVYFCWHGYKGSADNGGGLNISLVLESRSRLSAVDERYGGPPDHSGGPPLLHATFGITF